MHTRSHKCFGNCDALASLFCFRFLVANSNQAHNDVSLLVRRYEISKIELLSIDASVRVTKDNDICTSFIL